MLAGETVTGAVGIDDGLGFGQYITGQVVVGDDHPAAQFPCPPYAVNRTDTRVHGDQHIRWIVGQCFDQADAQTITKFESVGHPEIDAACRHQLQGPHRQRRAGRTVGVKVTDDQYALT